MKILFLAPRMPLPADTGGKIRTLNILRQVSKNASVHLVCFTFEPDDAQWAEQLRSQEIKVTLVKTKEDSVFKKINRVLWDTQPYSMSKYYTPEMEAVVTELLKSESFNAVHIDHLHMAHYGRCLNGTPSVLDEHNVEYKILERCANVEKNLAKRFVFTNQADKMRLFEQKNLETVSCYLAVSEDDRKILDELVSNSKKGTVIPNGVDTEFFTTNNKQKTEITGHQACPSIVFTGSMDWLPNEDSVLYFSKEILPLIWEKNPQVNFYVVGKSPAPAISNLGLADKRIIVTGRVDDVRPLMDAAQVFVVPLRIGGGTRLKILEAMAMQKAVVSTTIGAEGIQYTDGQNILLADTPENFAQKVLQLLSDPSKRMAMGEAGRKLVCSLYDWNIVGKKLNSIYLEITRARNGQG